MRRTLIVTRGLPGAGKTRRALRWVAGDPEHRARVGSDQIAEMLHPHVMLGTAAYNLVYADREQLAVNTLIEALLRSGLDVVCDDPFLLPHYLDAVRELAERCDADLVVWDMTDVPVEVCIARDLERGQTGGRSVGAEAIRLQDQQFREAQAIATAATTAKSLATAEGEYEDVEVPSRALAR